MLALGLATELVAAPARACSGAQQRPRSGPLATAEDTAFFFDEGEVPPVRRELARDRDDGSPVYGTRVFYSSEAHASLYRLEQPLVVGHTYEVEIDGRATDIVATASASTPALAAPNVDAVAEGEAEDAGACAWDCGEDSHRLVGPSGELEGSFYAIRFAPTAEEAENPSAPLHEVTMSGFFNTFQRGGGYARVTTFDYRGNESPAVVVPVEIEDESGGCAAAPRSSGAQLFVLLGFVALLRRRMRRADDRAACARLDGSSPSR